MKPMFVAMVIITVMVLPSVASDKTVFGRDNLTSDPWMVQGPAQANKPTHVIDGSTKGVNIVVGSMGEMGQANLDAYEAQNGVSIDAKGTHTLGPGITPRS